jgi:hypothetical protein
MLADLDLLLIAVFCTADDLLPEPAKNARRILTDAEVVTLCVAQSIMGISSDVRFLNAARRAKSRSGSDTMRSSPAPAMSPSFRREHHTASATPATLTPASSAKSVRRCSSSRWSRRCSRSPRKAKPTAKDSPTRSGSQSSPPAAPAGRPLDPCRAANANPVRREAWWRRARSRPPPAAAGELEHRAHRKRASFNPPARSHSRLEHRWNTSLERRGVQRSSGEWRALAGYRSCLQMHGFRGGLTGNS